MGGRAGKAILAVLAAGLIAAPATDAAPVPSGFYGATSNTYPSQDQLQRVSAGGVRTLRVQFYWGTVEPQPGVRNWQVLDQLVRDAATANVTVLPVLAGVPPWVSPNPNRPPIYTASEREGWAQFVRDLVARYGNTGTFWTLNPLVPKVPITAWQVGNEVNLAFFWGGRPNAVDYAGLLELTDTAIGASDPAARTIMAGLLPYRSEGAGSVSSEIYLKRLLRVRGVRDHFDVAAIHPFAEEPKMVIELLLKNRRELNRRGAKSVPLWATEFGWTTGGQGFRKSPLRTSQTEQSRRVSRTYRLLTANAKRLKLERALYYNLADSSSQAGWIFRMGLFDTGFNPKPSWFSFARRAGGTP